MQSNPKRITSCIFVRCDDDTCYSFQAAAAYCHEALGVSSRKLAESMVPLCRCCKATTQCSKEKLIVHRLIKLALDRSGILEDDFHAALYHLDDYAAVGIRRDVTSHKRAGCFGLVLSALLFRPVASGSEMSLAAQSKRRSCPSSPGFGQVERIGNADVLAEHSVMATRRHCKLAVRSFAARSC